MIDLALNVTHGLQCNTQRPDRADETAADHHILGDHIAFDLPALAENQGDARHIAVDLAVEMDFALRRNIASDF